jgi:hypothetical protein
MWSEKLLVQKKSRPEPGTNTRAMPMLVKSSSSMLAL